MHIIDTSTAVNGQFTNGDPLAGIPATEVDAAWLNDVQSNIAYAIEAAGIPLAKGDSAQLYKAIEALIVGAAAGAAPASPSSPAANQVAPYGMPTRAAMPAADANSLISSGFYACPAGSANMPAGSTSGTIFCAGNAAGNGDGGQVFVDVSGKAWARGRTNGNWGGWASSNPSASQALLQVNGHTWNAATGELRQWGYVQANFSEGEVNIPFQVQFDVCFGIRGWVINTSADISIGTWIDEVSVAPAAAVVLVNRVSSGSDNIPGFKWEAHGVAAAFALTGQTTSAGVSSSGSSGGSGTANSSTTRPS